MSRGRHRSSRTRDRRAAARRGRRSSTAPSHSGSSVAPTCRGHRVRERERHAARALCRCGVPDRARPRSAATRPARSRKSAKLKIASTDSGLTSPSSSRPSASSPWRTTASGWCSPTPSRTSRRPSSRWWRSSARPVDRCPTRPRPTPRSRSGRGTDLEPAEALHGLGPVTPASPTRTRGPARELRRDGLRTVTRSSPGATRLVAQRRPQARLGTTRRVGRPAVRLACTLS